MKTTRLLLLLLGITATAAWLALYQPRSGSPPSQPRESTGTEAPEPAEPPPRAALERSAPVSSSTETRVRPNPSPALEQTVASSNRLDRLNQIHEQFVSLAKGDPGTALAAARQFTNEVDRETALLALVTQWNQGELSSPLARAHAISSYGLDVGLGLELVSRHPELAVVWANELTEGQTRINLATMTASALLDSDPARAFALVGQVAPGERSQVSANLFAGWASRDTEAALQWAQTMPDPTERDAALQAIRSSAPVGIGAELRMQDGYPVISGLIPGAPAQLNGLLQKGDRILALAQGDGSFQPTQNIPLADLVQMIRGAPGTVLQLQVLAGDAPPGAAPRTVFIVRDQLKFKHP